MNRRFAAGLAMACDDEVIPLQERIEAIGDEADLREVDETERHLLYVACTRARNRLLVTGVEPGSGVSGGFGGRSRSVPRSAKLMASQPRVGRHLIYGLLDPRDLALRYVGKTHMRREHRLARHIERAIEGRTAPASTWIRELLDHGLAPQVFVLERLPPHQDWRGAERSAIERWRTWPDSDLPYVHPPQTPKSTPVEIRKVSLLNVRAGG